MCCLSVSPWIARFSQMMGWTDLDCSFCMSCFGLVTKFYFVETIAKERTNPMHVYSNKKQIIGGVLSFQGNTVCWWGLIIKIYMLCGIHLWHKSDRVYLSHPIQILYIILKYIWLLDFFYSSHYVVVFVFCWFAFAVTETNSKLGISHGIL